MSKKKTIPPSVAFDMYYASIYGPRWEGLKDSLLKNSENKVKIEGLKIDYYVDRASYIAALSLGAARGMNVLDMCAAPGGKSLIIAKSLQKSGMLTSNDISKNRRLKMLSTFNEALDEEERKHIRVTPFDASKYGIYHKKEYDRILLDAPCSSEAHVLKSKSHLDSWSLSRTKRLSMNQFALLSSALLSIKDGGRILYSTCSISPLENQCVIEKAIKRHGKNLREIELELDGFERLQLGYIALPDRSDMGPMYICLLEYNNEN